MMAARVVVRRRRGLRHAARMGVVASVAALSLTMTMAPANAATVSISTQTLGGPFIVSPFCTPFGFGGVGFGGLGFGGLGFGFGTPVVPRCFAFGFGNPLFGNPFVSFVSSSVAVNTGPLGTAVAIETTVVPTVGIFGPVDVFSHPHDGVFDIDHRNLGGGSAVAVNTAPLGTAVADAGRRGDATAINTGIGGTAVADSAGSGPSRHGGDATAINTGIGGTAVADSGGSNRHNNGNTVAINTGILGTAVATHGGTAVNTGILGTSVATGGGTAVNTGILGTAVAVGGHHSGGLVTPFLP